MKKSLIVLSLTAFIAGGVQAAAKPLSIIEQGSFATGGSVKQSQGHYNPRPAITQNTDSNSFLAVYQASVAEGGQTLHGDHAAVFYQIPENPKALPIVFLHGAGQSMRTWQTTPDGREGYQNLFLRAGYPVYLIDQPRRGQAGRATVDGSIAAAPDDQFWYAQFRLGEYPNRFDGIAFPKSKAALTQFFRQMTPNTAPFNSKIIAQSLAALFDRIGSGILLAHSQGGDPAWQTALLSDKVKAIATFEPGNFPFPKNETPSTLKSAFGDVTPQSISDEDFAKFTRLPIIIYYGDNIPAEEEVTNSQSQDQWRIRLALAQKWMDTVNRHGGDATLIHLPKIGIKGNTHFIMSDTNNAEVFSHLQNWLKQKGLDYRSLD
ncbi:alpha/beta fold hydrolase [Avibacterium sp. 21-595]|uniref:alpha/beta hydrolase n=1 Tax=Avibacterium sp. 21-595 TaxID=2911527 RepID=UPI002025D385|nr:alpha/beta fold hydrolase [Avibacterium sp. 21-595]URL06687.1 alpha/beta fold hydrolase [Avibacterium sp. 21-595]